MKLKKTLLILSLIPLLYYAENISSDNIGEALVSMGVTLVLTLICLTSQK